MTTNWNSFERMCLQTICLSNRNQVLAWGNPQCAHGLHEIECIPRWKYYLDFLTRFIDDGFGIWDPPADLNDEQYHIKWAQFKNDVNNDHDSVWEFIDLSNSAVFLDMNLEIKTDWIITSGLTINENLGLRWHSVCRYLISIPSPDLEAWQKKLHMRLSIGFWYNKNWVLGFFVSTPWCNMIFPRFRSFAWTMVVLSPLIGKLVPDGGKWGCFGTPRTTRITCDHRRYGKRSLSCIARACSVGACMAWRHTYSRVKQQIDVGLL